MPNILFKNAIKQGYFNLSALLYFRHYSKKAEFGFPLSPFMPLLNVLNVV